MGNFGRNMAYADLSEKQILRKLTGAEKRAQAFRDKHGIIGRNRAQEQVSELKWELQLRRM